MFKRVLFHFAFENSKMLHLLRNFSLFFFPLLGVLEGRRIPPPALTPLQNAPKPPNLDMFDRVDKKKKKKKKDRDRKEGKSPPPKPENPSDIPPPRGFAAPLHPHMQVCYSCVTYFQIFCLTIRLNERKRIKLPIL